MTGEPAAGAAARGAGPIDDGRLEARVRDLLDKQEIHEVIMRYCRGVDRRDRALIEAAFHPDATIDTGRRRLSGAGLADRMLAHEVDACHTHFVGNLLIELEGESAHSEAYFVSIVELERDGRRFTRLRGGRYLDRFQRRGGTWRIAQRFAVDDWDRLDEVAGHVEQIGGNRGRRAPEDLVYRLRQAAAPADNEPGATA